MNNSPWLTIEQAAKYAQVSPRTIKRWLTDGLQHSKIGRTVRIDQIWVDEYLRAFSDSKKNVDVIAQEIKEAR